MSRQSLIPYLIAIQLKLTHPNVKAISLPDNTYISTSLEGVVTEMNFILVLKVMAETLE